MKKNDDVGATSVRLRFDKNGRSVWEAEDYSEETVRLLAALNDEDEEPDPDDTVAHRVIVAPD